MKSTALLLSEYGDALRKWKKMKEVREDAGENNRLKPLPPEPNPTEFGIKADDVWTIKTRDLIMRKRILPVKLSAVKLPVRRTK